MPTSSLLLTLATTLFTIVTFSAALPATLSTNGLNPCGIACTQAPTGFTISNFRTFSPSSVNPNQNSTISFSYTDNMTGAKTSCSAISSGAQSPPTLKGKCTDSTITFKCTGGSPDELIMTKEYEACDTMKKSDISGSVSLSTYCYPTEPPMPLGYGTQCQMPGSGDSGSFNNATIVTHY